MIDQPQTDLLSAGIQLGGLAAGLDGLAVVPLPAVHHPQLQVYFGLVNWPCCQAQRLPQVLHGLAVTWQKPAEAGRSLLAEGQARGVMCTRWSPPQQGMPTWLTCKGLHQPAAWQMAPWRRALTRCAVGLHGPDSGLTLTHVAVTCCASEMIVMRL